MVALFYYKTFTYYYKDRDNIWFKVKVEVGILVVWITIKPFGNTATAHMNFILLTDALI